MYQFPRLLLSSAVCAFIAPAAHADLTAQDVWSEWQTYITTFGYEMTGTETRIGDTLVISGLRITESMGTTIDIDRIELAEQSDGSVVLDLPALVPFTMALPDDESGWIKASMDFRQTGLTMVATGTPDAMSYSYAADRMDIVATGFEDDGELLEAGDMTIEMSASDVAGRTDMTLGQTRSYNQTLNVASVSALFDAGQEIGPYNAKLQSQDMAFTGSSDLPIGGPATSDITELLARGFKTDGIFTYGANAISLLAPGSIAASYITGNGSLRVAMGGSKVSYSGLQNDTAIAVSGAQIPVPIDATLSNSTFEMTMPVRETETTEDFSLALNMDGLELSDLVWGMFDPAGQLPRDPAQATIDLSGKARLMFDFLKLDQMEPETFPDTPLEVEKLDVNTLLLSLAGAELTGKGAFQFQNQAFGFPQPNGEIDLKLVGANGLLDRLVAIGILPDQQAMAARMMMGLLAVPGDAPDTLNSKIEINEQGHISANGQRFQ